MLQLSPTGDFAFGQRGARPARWAALLGLLAALGCRAQAPAPSAGDPLLERSLAAEVQAFDKADLVAPPAPCQVLFVGSSSIVKWKEHLAADMAPMPALDRGFGGSHIEYVNRWFDRLVARYRPRAIVFYAGENDIDAGKSVQRVVADFDTFMSLKSAALGATPVYFISLKPSKQRFAELSLQAKVNDAIRARAAQRSDLHYIDVVAAMLEHGRPRDLYEADGLHMSAPGYAIWTQAVRAALLPNTQREQRSCELLATHAR